MTCRLSGMTVGGLVGVGRVQRMARERLESGKYAVDKITARLL